MYLLDVLIVTGSVCPTRRRKCNLKESAAHLVVSAPHSENPCSNPFLARLQAMDGSTCLPTSQDHLQYSGELFPQSGHQMLQVIGVTLFSPVRRHPKTSFVMVDWLLYLGLQLCIHSSCILPIH